MAGTVSEVGKAARDIASHALQAGIARTGGGDFSFNVTTDNVQVAKEICGAAVELGKELCGTAVKLSAIYASYQLLKQLIDAAVTKVLGGGERDDQDDPEIRPGSLHVQLRCFTDERFLEVLADYESGGIEERLQQELSSVGIKTEGLKVEVKNMKEVAERKAAIYKSLHASLKNCIPWTDKQRYRLTAEKIILEKYFPDRVTWIEPTGDTKVEVSLSTNNGNQYCLRIYLKLKDGSSDFPNSVPDMVVRSSPNPMPSWGVDANTHTLGYRDGFLKICHYHPELWRGDATLYEVVMRGRLWLEAYDGYLMTGEYPSTFLGEMRE